MACGVPAVVSDIPVLRETTGGNALYADPLAPSSWLEALTSLENDQFYRCQSQRGRVWARRYKGTQAWDKHITDIESLLAPDKTN
jgi:glycosyltransferase involved in cell wall biosynthesis